jgi:hypothetical protein
MALSSADAAKLQQQLQEIERLSRLLGANINTINLQPIEENAGAIEAIFQRLTNQAEGLGEETDYLVSNFQKLVGEIKKTSVGVNESTKGLRALSSITEQISGYQKGYNDLSSKEIDKLKKKVEFETNRLKIAKDTLKEEGLEISQKIRSGNLAPKQLQAEQEKLAKILTARRNIKQLLKSDDITLTELNNKLKEAEENAKHMEKTLGLTGAALKGISKIPLLGDIIDTNAALEAAKNNINKAGNRTSAMKAAFGNMGEQIKTNLTDPMAVTGFLVTQMVDALIKGDTAAGDLAKDFNITYEEANGVREQLTQMAVDSGDVAINTRALQESMVAIGKTLGSNAILNKQDLFFMTQMREKAGMTNEEMTSLERTTLATGGNLEDNVKNLIYSAKITSLNNKVLLNEKDIMRDVAKTSDSVKLSLAGNPEALGKAAAQAKSLGMNLEQVDKIAESLLDFESSITNELSAELITGKQLNLEQARLYALNNDMEGLSREIAKNYGTTAEFSKMNRIQQDAAAKAVGMSREELASTLTDQEALKGLSGKQAEDAKAALDAARARGMSESEIAKQGIDNLQHQQSIQERLNKSIEKMKEIFIAIAEPLLEILSPLTDLLVDILPPILSLLQPVLGVFRVIADIITGIVKTLQGDFSGALKSFDKISDDFTKGITSFGPVKLINEMSGGSINKSIESINTIGKSSGYNNVSVPQQDLSPLLDEMRAMRQEQSKSNSKPVIIENSMDSTRFGTAVAMNTYKVQ